jgi:Transglycosylase
MEQGIVAFLSATSSQAMHPMGNYAATKMKLKRVDTICEDFTFGYEEMGAFQQVFQDNGGQVIKKLKAAQQLVRTRFLGHERHLFTQTARSAGSGWFDLQLSKDEILTDYLNRVYLGTVPVAWPQPHDCISTSACLISRCRKRSPLRDNPLQSPDRARARTAVVIDAMLQKNAIDAETAKNAKAHPPVLTSRVGQCRRARSWPTGLRKKSPRFPVHRPGSCVCAPP